MNHPSKYYPRELREKEAKAVIDGLELVKKSKEEYPLDPKSGVNAIHALMRFSVRMKAKRVIANTMGIECKDGLDELIEIKKGYGL